MEKITCPECAKEGRNRTAVSRGLCEMHYARARRANTLDGAPLQPRMQRGAEAGPCQQCVTEGELKPRTVQVRGLCRVHYSRGRDDGTILPKYAMRGASTICSVDGCDRGTKARGLCATHYGRRYRGGDPDAPIREGFASVCSFEGCDSSSHSKGLCGAHAWQKRQGRELTPIATRATPGGPCAVDGCPKPSAHLGMCHSHYKRKSEGESDWDRPVLPKAPNGSGHVDKQGYRFIQHNGRKVAQHRAIMEELLGRPLYENENVHHLNGNRVDNRTDGPLVLDSDGKLRSGNLQLWSTRQPPGQELGPKMDWAAEMIDDYAQVDLPVAVRVLMRTADVVGQIGSPVQRKACAAFFRALAAAEAAPAGSVNGSALF